MRGWGRVRAVAVSLAAGLLAHAPAGAGEPARPGPAFAPPQRVVSLDYCADHYVLALLEPARIAALSPGADDDYAPSRAAAAGFAIARGGSEGVLAFRPDAVVRTWGGGAHELALYRRAGITVITVPYADDFDGVAQALSAVGSALGTEARAGQITRAMAATRKELARQAPQDATRRPAAYYWSAGGATAGTGTFLDAILHEAGYRNVAGEEGLAGWAAASVEHLITATPDLVVSGFFDTRATAMDQWTPARHPAVRARLDAQPSLALSSADISCPSWRGLEAARALAGFRASQANADGAP